LQSLKFFGFFCWKLAFVREMLVSRCSAMIFGLGIRGLGRVTVGAVALRPGRLLPAPARLSSASAGHSTAPSAAEEPGWKSVLNAVNQVRDDVKELRGEMKQLRGDMKQQGDDLRSEMKQLGDDLRSELKQQGDDLRSEMKQQGDDLRSEMNEHRAETAAGFKGLRTERNAMHRNPFGLPPNELAGVDASSANELAALVAPGHAVNPWQSPAVQEILRRHTPSALTAQLHVLLTPAQRHGGPALSLEYEAALAAPEVCRLMEAPTEDTVRAAVAPDGALGRALKAMGAVSTLSKRPEFSAVHELLEMYGPRSSTSKLQKACSGPAALCVLTHVARTYWAQLEHVTAEELPLLAQPHLDGAEALARKLQALQLYLNPRNAGVTEHEHDGIGNVLEYAAAPRARVALIHRLEIKSGSDAAAAAAQLGPKLVAEAMLHHSVRDHGKQPKTASSDGKQPKAASSDGQEAPARLHTAEYRLRGLLYVARASTTSALRLPVANDVPLPWYPDPEQHGALCPGVVFGHAGCAMHLHFEAAAGWSSALLPIEPVTFVGQARPQQQLAASA